MCVSVDTDVRICFFKRTVEQSMYESRNINSAIYTIYDPKAMRGKMKYCTSLITNNDTLSTESRRPLHTSPRQTQKKKKRKWSHCILLFGIV